VRGGTWDGEVRLIVSTGMRTRHRHLLASLLFGLTSCDRAPSSAPPRAPSVFAAEQRWSIDSVPSLVVTSSEAAMFTSISGAAQLQDGRVLVTDASLPAIWLFDANGAFVRTVARDGDGPQEIRFPSIRQRLSGDRFLIADRQRLRLLEPDLTFSRKIGPPGAVGGSYWRPIGMLADGAMVAIDTKLLPFVGEPGQIDSLTAAIVRVGDSFLDRDTIAVLTDGTDWVTEAMGDGVGRPLQHFGWRLNAATDGTSIYATQGRSARVIRYSMDGRTVDTIATWEAMPRAVSDVERERVTQSLRAVNAVPSTYGDARFASHRPAIGSPLIDRDGDVWIIGYANQWGITPDSAWVFSPDGTLLAAVRFPRGFTPLEIGRDYLLGRELDDEDVPRVVRYRMRKQLPGARKAR
jgi:hypothetical protein